VLINLATPRDSQSAILIYAHDSAENWSPVNKPSRLISPKSLGPEVGLISGDYSTKIPTKISYDKIKMIHNNNPTVTS